MWPEAVLEVSGLSVSYGGLQALSGVSLQVRQGEFVTVVGPNGAGKSTLFKAVSGVVAAQSGTVRYEGTDLLAMRPDRRAHLGIAHVPEGRQVFKAMTVRENLDVGAGTKAGRAGWARTLDRIHTLFPRLAERAGQLAGTLSGGEQQMLAIGRGLASAPRLLMLDEPSMGLAPAVADMIFERIAQVHREDGLTVLLVEQRVAEALELCDQGFVLETGRMVMQGSFATLMADDRIRQSYLGLGGGETTTKNGETVS